jgi:tetratricopeptide (TPR) repeat protein
MVAMLAAGTPMGAAAQGADDIAALNRQAVQLYGQGKYKEAATVAEKARALAEQAFGPEHPITLQSVNDLAFLYQAQGRLAEAEPLYKRALEARERVLGKEHPGTLISVNNLGFLYQA